MRVLILIQRSFKKRPVHYTLQGQLLVIFQRLLLSIIGTQYITLYGLQFWLTSWPSGTGPSKLLPQCKERIGRKFKSPNRDNFKGKAIRPNFDSVLIRLRKGVRIGFLQTSKNWESLEVSIVRSQKKKLVVLKALPHRAFFL